MKVELDLFSGRPNPVWSLTEWEAFEFNEHLKTKSELPFKAIQNSNLGYRGFVVRDAIRIFEGVIWFENKVLLDASRELERFLLETGRQHLEAAVFELVLTQLM